MRRALPDARWPFREVIALTLHSRLRIAGTLTLTVFAIAASQSVTRQADAAGGAGICRRDAAEALTGKKRITNAQAKRITGASIVRQIKPGQPVTMDYRQERVTIETDPKTGRIIRAYCG
jgi:hypothetical protein